MLVKCWYREKEKSSLCLLFASESRLQLVVVLEIVSQLMLN